MAETSREIPHNRRSRSARRQQQFFAFNRIPGRLDNKTIRSSLYPKNGAISEYLHAGLSRSAQKALDDRCRLIGDGKHAAVPFCL